MQSKLLSFYYGGTEIFLFKWRTIWYYITKGVSSLGTYIIGCWRGRDGIRHTFWYFLAEILIKYEQKKWMIWQFIPTWYKVMTSPFNDVFWDTLYSQHCHCHLLSLSALHLHYIFFQRRREGGKISAWLWTMKSTVPQHMLNE